MTYDDAKADVLALVPEMGDLYVRQVDNQLLLVRYALAGVVIVTYGPEETGSADSNVHLQRFTLEAWVDQVTQRHLRRVDPTEFRSRERIVFDAGSERWGPLPRFALPLPDDRDQSGAG